MRGIGDDPIVGALLRTGYPPWFGRGLNEYSERDAEADRGKDDDDKP